jgi:hypothetical protein
VLLPFENRHWPASSRKDACPAISLDTVSTWTEEAATTTQTTFLPGLSGSLEFLSGRWADRSQPKSYGFAKTPALIRGIFPKTLVPTGMVLPTEFWDKAGYCLIFGLLASGGSGFSEQRARCAPQRQDKWAAEAP